LKYIIRSKENFVATGQLINFIDEGDSILNRYVRYLLFGICAAQAVLAIAFLLQMPFAIQLWPIPDTTPMSFIFVSSIIAAACASTLWCLLAREDGALAGIALDYIAIFITLSVFALQMFSSSGNNGLIVFALMCMSAIVVGLYLLRITINVPIRDQRPLPLLVKGSFAVFIIALILVGGALILRTPNILPWSVTADLGVIFGWMFLGAAGYFAYSLLRPSWHNAVGQLAGFLAYDVILIVPFLQRLPTIAPELRTSLIIYLIVVTYSGLLAIYYLFINPATRIWRSGAVQGALAG
jgi:hypothetical protein